MTKLSTDILKKMISSWIASTDIGNTIEEIWKDRLEEESEEELRNYMNEFKIPKSVPVQGLPVFMKTQIMNGDNWKRWSKNKLGPNAQHSFILDSTTGFYSMGIIDDGDGFPDVEAKLTAKDLEKCIVRQFSPPQYLGDRYRLEIITTPDDTEVVGWTTVED